MIVDGLDDDKEKGDRGTCLGPASATKQNEDVESKTFILNQNVTPKHVYETND